MKLSFAFALIFGSSFCSKCRVVVSGQSIADLAQGSEDLTTLVAAVVQAGFVDALSDPEADLTVFAPTDDAFAKLDPDLLAKLLTPNWAVHLTSLLSHHLVSGTVMSTDITDGLVVDSLLAPLTVTQMAPLTFSTSTEGGVFVSGLAFNRSQVIVPDLIADNGVVHVVDQVFVPNVVCCTSLYTGLGFVPVFSTLYSLLGDAGLAEFVATETLTGFGPPDAVFDSLPEGALDSVNVTAVLLNHFVVGPPLLAAVLAETATVTTALGIDYDITMNNGTLFIGTVPIVQADVAGSNGIGHVIGGILLPPTSDGEEEEEEPEELIDMEPEDPTDAGNGKSVVVGAAVAVMAFLLC